MTNNTDKNRIKISENLVMVELPEKWLKYYMRKKRIWVKMDDEIINFFTSLECNYIVVSDWLMCDLINRTNNYPLNLRTYLYDKYKIKIIDQLSYNFEANEKIFDPIFAVVLVKNK